MRSRKASKSEPRHPAVQLSPSEPADLQRKVQRVQLAVAQRAHELFEARGRKHGHDLEDWLGAESELLFPVSIAMSESEDSITVRANVAGFDESELEVSLEPSRVTIFGKKKQSNGKAEAGTAKQISSYPDQILEVIDLATEVMPERAVVSLQGGELNVKVPPVSKDKSGIAPK
jgi:HSP20 family molecular chaperone IbpA